MSAVQDEATNGPEHLDSDDEDQEQGRDISREIERPPAEGPTLHKSQQQDDPEEGSLPSNGVTFKGNGKRRQNSGADETSSGPQTGIERPSSADGSLSIPDDTPSIQGSLASSPSRGGRLGSHSQSPTPSLRPFDRRFQSRISSSPLSSSRANSPAFLNTHSRQASTSYIIPDTADTEVEAPWDVVRWTRLRKITGEAFSEVGKRKFGRPTCIAISASIALGTSKGYILMFDYNQSLKSVIGPGTKAVESGSVTSISISADHSTIAGGHASGSIFTWEVARTAKPFLHIPPIDRNRAPNADGHTLDVAILHIGFLGIRHTALASADDKGMAFSHLATRGMGMVARSVKTTRILGRYSESTSLDVRQKKPSSVLSFSPLPLGNAEHGADNMGLVAMLTPYLLVIVSTMPIAQTQYKAPRPKEVAAHGAMTAALAWFPSVKLKSTNGATSESASRTKLVYCWSNILTVLEIAEIEPSEMSGKSEPPNLQFKPRSRWKAQEAIVGVQWLSRSVLAVLTITQQLVILEDVSMIVTDSSDLIQKHIYHKDLFSQQLNHLVDQLEDEEVAAMHGVVADAFYMSFRAYKGRLFLLGHSEISFGTLSNWADRLLALMEDGNYIGAIELATGYYTGQTDTVTVGLPDDDESRHRLVQEKLSDMMLASLKFAFGKSKDTTSNQAGEQQLEQLASACITACVSMDEMDFLFDDVYSWYHDKGQESVFLEKLESYIDDNKISTIPPTVIKDLVGHYTAEGFNARLEDMICRLDPRTMDIDQVTILCKRNGLYDALLYVWSQALGDYTTLLNDLLDLADARQDRELDPQTEQKNTAIASKIFPYLSYILTSRIYPTGRIIAEDAANLAKAEIYHFFFSGRDSNVHSHMSETKASFPNLRRVLEFDAPSFLSMINEAFEDSFLNGTQERMAGEQPGQLTEQQKFGLSVNRQWIVSILLEVMTPPYYEPDDTIYLDIFIARNLPKFPQFILLPGHVLHRVLVGLCNYPSDDVADDCQLSVEYLLSMYQPPDLGSLIPLLSEARFYRVLKGVYKADNQYAKLLQTCFDDYSNPGAVFDCIQNCLRPGSGLDERQVEEVRAVIVEHANNLVAMDVFKSASSIDQVAPDLHEIMLAALSEDEAAQFRYLQTVLEPSIPKAEGDGIVLPPRRFVEQYVRLLCDYSPSHVSDYVERLKTGALRLEEVLPALEDSGAIDAAIVLMAREGKIREGIDRLVQHLGTLESALLGLIDGAQDSPDIANTTEAGRDLTASIQKYVRVGVWLCQTQSKAVKQRKPNFSRAKSIKSMNDALSADEDLWLDLVDTVVVVTKQITGVLERKGRGKESNDEDGVDHFGATKIITDLRTIVQETFTALLTTTSAPATTDSHRTDMSFLRILRAFLSRASLSSPSLSNLRAVLAAIFSAYSYEESLLALSNRLLDKDLFVRVTEADTLRRRGWRPLGQVCEGCGKRVWGPGAGGYIWDAWQQDNDRRSACSVRTGKVASGSSSRASNGKGKASTKHDRSTSEAERSTGDEGEAIGDETGAIVIFACRHLFHRSCLERMQDHGVEVIGRPAGLDLSCPLCT